MYVQLFIVIVGGIVCALSSLYCLPMELCAFLIVHIDFLWNCVSVQ